MTNASWRADPLSCVRELRGDFLRHALRACTDVHYQSCHVCLLLWRCCFRRAAPCSPPCAVSSIYLVQEMHRWKLLTLNFKFATAHKCAAHQSSAVRAYITVMQAWISTVWSLLVVRYPTSHNLEGPLRSRKQPWKLQSQNSRPGSPVKGAGDNYHLPRSLSALPKPAVRRPLSGASNSRQARLAGARESSNKKEECKPHHVQLQLHSEHPRRPSSGHKHDQRSSYQPPAHQQRNSIPDAMRKDGGSVHWRQSADLPAQPPPLRSWRFGGLDGSRQQTHGRVDSMRPDVLNSEGGEMPQAEPSAGVVSGSTWQLPPLPRLQHCGSFLSAGSGTAAGQGPSLHLGPAAERYSGGSW